MTFHERKDLRRFKYFMYQYGWKTVDCPVCGGPQSPCQMFEGCDGSGRKFLRTQKAKMMEGYMQHEKHKQKAYGFLIPTAIGNASKSDIKLFLHSQGYRDLKTNINRKPFLALIERFL